MNDRLPGEQASRQRRALRGICLFVVMRTVVVYLNNNLVLKANVVGPTPVS